MHAIKKSDLVKFKMWRKQIPAGWFQVGVFFPFSFSSSLKCHGPLTSLSETNYTRCQSQSLKSPLLLWITGGAILHPAFFSYLPPGLLLLCGSNCASALPPHLPRDELRWCVCVWVCECVWERWTEREWAYVPACVQDRMHVLVIYVHRC